MKHELKIVVILVTLFLASQFIGLGVISGYLDEETTKETGNVTWEKLPTIANVQIERPELEEETSYIPIMISVLIATILFIILMKLKLLRVWKLWFFIGITFTLLIAFGSFLQGFIAFILAIILAILKIFKPNVYIHNFTELFTYGGLAAIFVPVLNVLSVTILLIAISIYDMIAVWKTKHMVSMAKFQAKAKIFAGLLIPYKKGRTAVLGGGDIGFPLLFSGVILKTNDFLSASIVILSVAIALLLLFIFGKKDKFYPAMPYLTGGCFAGYLITLLI